MAATPFQLGAQRGWAHDAGHPAGAFHTYDALDVLPGVAARKVHVLVPRERPPPGGFPTLYLHDGDTAFWRGGVADDTWDVAGTLSSARARPRVVVAVHPIDRNFEYTHADWSGGRRSWGGLAGHADYLADGVRRFVAAHYPVSSDPRDTAVAGSSHGGLAAFWTATRRPDCFGSAGCFSPSFFTGIDDLVPAGSRPLPLREAEIVTGGSSVLSDPERRPRLWICWGGWRSGGEHNAVVEHLATLRAREMRDLLAAQFGYETAQWPATAELTWAEVAAHGHDEGAWRERFGWFAQAEDARSGRAGG